MQVEIICLVEIMCAGNEGSPKLGRIRVRARIELDLLCEGHLGLETERESLWVFVLVVPALRIET